MHTSALHYGKQFFDLYVRDKMHNITIVDIGAQDVNGSLRDVAPDGHRYIGVDFAMGKGVNIILQDPYKFPFHDNYCEVIVSSSCFEHSEFFWLTFLEMARVLKPNGYMYINVPSTCWYHAYPVDCWRFLKDSGNAMAKWAQRNHINIQLLESFEGYTDESGNRDYVAIYTKMQ